MQSDQIELPSRRGFIAAAGAAVLATGLAASAKGAEVKLDPPNREAANLPVPGPQEKKTGWALVGLGELCLEEALPALMQTQHCRPVALVSGHPEKAKSVAAAYGIDAKAIYSYDNFAPFATTPVSMSCTSSCRIQCMQSLRFAHLRPANTSSAKSRWPKPWPNVSR